MVMPAVEMSNALRGAEYHAGYFDQVSGDEIKAMSAAIAFINDPDGRQKYGRRFVFEFELLVKNVCARVNTNRLLHKIAHGLNDINPLPIGTRAGPTVEFRAMYHLAILLTCLRKAALVFVDDSEQTVGHTHTFAGCFCEGTLREWNATCLVAWSKQTGRPDPTPSNTAAPVKYRGTFDTGLAVVVHSNIYNDNYKPNSQSIFMKRLAVSGMQHCRRSPRYPILTLTEEMRSLKHSAAPGRRLRVPEPHTCQTG